jgi:hypothetical protein
MLKFLKVLFSVAIFFVLAGCASSSRQHAERAVEEIFKRNGNCTTSACTLTMMRQLNDALPNSEPHKGPILNMMFKL